MGRVYPLTAFEGFGAVLESDPQFAKITADSLDERAVITEFERRKSRPHQGVDAMLDELQVVPLRRFVKSPERGEQQQQRQSHECQPSPGGAEQSGPLLRFRPFHRAAYTRFPKGRDSNFWGELDAECRADNL